MRKIKNINQNFFSYSCFRERRFVMHENLARKIDFSAEPKNGTKMENTELRQAVESKLQEIRDFLREKIIKSVGLILDGEISPCLIRLFTKISEFSTKIPEHQSKTPEEIRLFFVQTIKNFFKKNGVINGFIPQINDALTPFLMLAVENGGSLKIPRSEIENLSVLTSSICDAMQEIVAEKIPFAEIPSPFSDRQTLHDFETLTRVLAFIKKLEQDPQDEETLRKLETVLIALEYKTEYTEHTAIDLKVLQEAQKIISRSSSL